MSTEEQIQKLEAERDKYKYDLARRLVEISRLKGTIKFQNERAVKNQNFIDKLNA